MIPAYHSLGCPKHLWILLGLPHFWHTNSISRNLTSDPGIFLLPFLSEIKFCFEDLFLFTCSIYYAASSSVVPDPDWDEHVAASWSVEDSDKSPLVLFRIQKARILIATGTN